MGRWHRVRNETDTDDERPILEDQNVRLEGRDETREDYASVLEDVTDEDDYGHDEPEERAVPVYQIAPPPYDTNRLTDWFPSRHLILSERATQIAGGQHARKRLYVRHNGAEENDPVYLLKDPLQPYWTGFELMPGHDVELTHSFDVWAVTVGAAREYVSTLDEFDLVDND